MSSMPRIELIVNGMIYSGWLQARVTRGIERCVSDFELSVTERWPGRQEAWPIAPGSACKLRLDGEDVVDGYVDTYAPQVTPSDHTVTIAGRSRTADLVDCSIVIPGGQFFDADLAQLARAVTAPFAVEVRVEADVGRPFPDVSVTPGESPFDFLDRLAVSRGLLITDAPDGALVITRAKAHRSKGTLVLGRNVVEGAASLSNAARFSRYIVDGYNWVPGERSAEDDIYFRAEVVDTEIRRYRPIRINALGLGSHDGASGKDQATWEMARRRGLSHQASVTVVGWRDDAGALWEPNRLVAVDMPLLGVSQDLLITEVEHTVGDDGARTRMRLARPEAYTPDPSALDAGRSGSKQGSGWTGLNKA